MEQGEAVEAMDALRRGVAKARPWWSVRATVPPGGPPGAGLLEIRAQMRRSEQFRHLRLWFRLDTTPVEAVDLIEHLLPKADVPSGVDLYAWEWRRGDDSAQFGPGA